jgi:hypothetical protein
MASPRSSNVSEMSISDSAMRAAKAAALAGTESAGAVFATGAAGAAAAGKAGTAGADFVGTGAESAFKIGSHGAVALQEIAGSAGKYGAISADHGLRAAEAIAGSGADVTADLAKRTAQASKGVTEATAATGERVMRDIRAKDHRRALAAAAATKGREAPGYAKAQLDQQIAYQQADIGQKAFKSREALRAQESQHRIMGQRTQAAQDAEEARGTAASEIETNRLEYVSQCKKKLKELSNDKRRKFSWDIKSDKARNKYCREYGSCLSSGSRYGGWAAAPGRSSCTSLIDGFDNLSSKLETAATPAIVSPVGAVSGLDEGFKHALPSQGGTGGRKSRRRRRKSRRRKATKKRSGRKSGRKSGRNRRRRRRTVKKKRN